MILERYNIWFSKKTENLRKTKGMESKLLLARIQSLEESHDMFTLQKQVTLFHQIVKEYAQEKRHLKWLDQLVQEVKEWKNIVESDLSLSVFSVDALVDALSMESIDMEQALDLMENDNG